MVSNMKKKERVKENFFVRLMDVIDLPLIIFLVMEFVNQAVSSLNFEGYFEYAMYIGFVMVGGGVVLKVWTGVRAVKDKRANVKPWVAGAMLSLIVSVVSIVMSLVVMIYFPNMMMTELPEGGEITTELPEGGEITTELIGDDDMTTMDMVKWTLFGSGFSLLGSVLFGAVFGALGGAIGKD